MRRGDQTAARVSTLDPLYQIQRVRVTRKEPKRERLRNVLSPPALQVAKLHRLNGDAAQKSRTAVALAVPHDLALGQQSLKPSHTG